MLTQPPDPLMIRASPALTILVAAVITALVVHASSMPGYDGSRTGQVIGWAIYVALIFAVAVVPAFVVVVVLIMVPWVLIRAAVRAARVGLRVGTRVLSDHTEHI